MKAWLTRWFGAAALGLTLAAAIPETPIEAAPVWIVWDGQTLFRDPTGDGRIAVVAGDLARAERIAVLVPGAGTTLDNFYTGLGGVSRRSPAQQAQALHAATGGTVAVIAWLGYDPPEGIGRAAIRSERAVAGARALERFLAELSAYHPHATYTVLGHSYGSLVVAYAAARLPDSVTDLVMLGSPGLDIARLDGLHTSARVWVASAAGDWTRWIPDIRIMGIGHGANPSRPWFGARVVDASDARGHDGYYLPGTATLRRLAAIAAGTA